MTRDDLVTHTMDYMDATGSERWDTPIVLATLDNVYDTEWSNLLAASPYYRAATRSVTTDSTGAFALSALASGSGDSAQRFYRIITVADSNSVYDEVRFQDIPLALTSNYQPYQWDRLYYLLGENVQILPAGAVALSVTVNYKPPLLSSLSAGTVEPDFPAGSEMLLAWQAGAKLLLKGGAETQAASDLLALAKEARDRMLLDIYRRTINPMRVMPVDDARDWAGA